MEEFEFYKHKQNTKRSRMDEDLYEPHAYGTDEDYQREADEWRYADNKDYSRGNQRGAKKRRYEDYSWGNQRGGRRQSFGEYSRGNQGGRRQSFGEYSRGNQGGKWKRMCEDNGEYSGENQKSARERIREENEEYLRENQMRTRERSFEEYSREDPGAIRDFRGEEIEDYSRERDQRWNYEERTREELDLLEKERLELRRLEEKLQSVLVEADSPNGREEYHDGRVMSEDEEARYSEDRAGWAWSDRDSPGAYRDRSRSPFGDRDDDESSYHSDDDGYHWQRSQYSPEDSHQEGYWSNASGEPRHITGYSGSNQYNPDAGGYTGDVSSSPRAGEEDYKLTIVRVGYPEVSIDKRLRFRKIRRDILKPWRNKRWVALSEEEKAMYGIKDVKWLNGKVVVTCSNSHTRDWLFRYVPFMRPFKGTTLRTIEKDEEESAVNTAVPDTIIPRTRVEGPERTIPRSSITFRDRTFVKFIGIFRKLSVSNEVILELFQIQNKGIDSSIWEVVSRRQLPNAEGVELMISVDSDMAKVIASRRFKLYCGYHEVRLHLEKS